MAIAIIGCGEYVPGIQAILKGAHLKSVVYPDKVRAIEGLSRKSADGAVICSDGAISPVCDFLRSGLVGLPSMPIILMDEVESEPLRFVARVELQANASIRPHEIGSLPALLKSPPAIDHYRILVSEDHEDTIEQIGRVLSGDSRYSVTHAKTIVDTADKIRSWKPQIVFQDLMLPPGPTTSRVGREYETGLDLIKFATAEDARTQVIFSSAYAEAGNVAAALLNGAATVIRKPFKPTHLRTELGRAIGRWRCRSILPDVNVI